MTAPAWQAATAGQAPQAAHINQLLSTHTATILYTGILTSAETTPIPAAIWSDGQWLAQSFTTTATQTTVGYVQIPLTTPIATGAALPPTTLALYANAAGAPTGSPLVSTTITAEYAYQASGGGTNTTTMVTYPLPASGLTPNTTYWLVLAPAGIPGTWYLWNQTTQTSGASISTDGVTWTPRTYGLMYEVYDQSATLPLVGTWEDGGARWTVIPAYAAYNQPAALAEYTAGQTPAGYLQSYRTLTYTNFFVLTAVT